MEAIRPALHGTAGGAWLGRARQGLGAARRGRQGRRQPRRQRPLTPSGAGAPFTAPGGPFDRLGYHMAHPGRLGSAVGALVAVSDGMVPGVSDEDEDERQPQTCGQCGGDGSVDEEWEERCGYCGGDDEECGSCSGSGYEVHYENVTCPGCGGSGVY